MRGALLAALAAAAEPMREDLRSALREVDEEVAGSIAVMQYGTAPHSKRSGVSHASYTQFMSICAPAHRKFVLAPLRAARWRVDSFVHSWAAPKLERAWQEAMMRIEPGAAVELTVEPDEMALCELSRNMSLTSCGQVGALLSILHVLGMAQDIVLIVTMRHKHATGIQSITLNE